MMNNRLKRPAIVLVIGLVIALVACLITNVSFTPVITEYEFPYSVTYKLNGETKTHEGVFKCYYEGFGGGQDPRDRYYSGEYIVNGVTDLSHTYTIAEKDGAELYIVTTFNECNLMGDTGSINYEPYHSEPYLEALTSEGYAFEEGQAPEEFTSEIISWEYPESIKNTFRFTGFSILHVGSMLAMVLVGLLVILATVIFVRRDKSVPYKLLDKLSVFVNFAVLLVALPFIVLVTGMMQLAVSGDELAYQILLCIPALTAFALAASIALRRCNYTKSGFFIQFAGPALFMLIVVLDSII